MKAPACQIPEPIIEQPIGEIKSIEFIIPDEKKAEMISYAKKLRKNSPKMKEARIMRKVAEKFKVNLV